MAMRVGFVLTRMQKTPVGGYKVVYQYANYLAACGYDVTIYYESSDVGESFTMLPRVARRMVARQWVKEGPVWFPLSKSVKQKAIFGIDNKQIADADVVVATAVRTAQGVAALSPAKGRKLYHIQDYEVWGDYSEEEVKATYALGMKNMVISEWLGDIVREACGEQPILMPDGIDHSIFCPDSAIAREEHTVALLYSENPWKGCKDAIAALMLAKQQVPDLRVEIFGGPSRPEDLPVWFAYTQNATQEQLHAIYNRASVVLCASVDEGFGLTGLEGMSCGCALVSTAYPGVYVYADESCALLSKQQDPEALAENLVRVLTDGDSRARYSSAALERASEYDLEKSCEKFKRVVDGSLVAERAHGVRPYHTSSPSPNETMPPDEGSEPVAEKNLDGRPKSGNASGCQLSAVGAPAGDRPESADGQGWRRSAVGALSERPLSESAIRSQSKILIDMTQVTPQNPYFSIAIWLDRFVSNIDDADKHKYTLLAEHGSLDYIKNKYPGFTYVTGEFGGKPYRGEFLEIFRSRRRYKKMVADGGYDCVFIAQDVAWYSCVRLPAKKVAVIYDLKGTKNREYSLKERVRSFLHVDIWHYYKRSINTSDAIIAISKYTKDDIGRVYPDVDLSKINVIYCSVPVATSSKRPHGIEVDSGFILYVNTLQEYKNVMTLIRAMTIVQKSCDKKLVLVGKKTDYWDEVILPYIEAHDLRDAVIRLENLSEEELRWLYERAALFVTPSKHEGFGFTPIEAAMSGCPVVSSTCEALPDTTMGLLNYYEPVEDEAALAEQIISILDNPPSAEELQDIADTYRTRYDVKTQAKCIQNLLDSVCGTC